MRMPASILQDTAAVRTGKMLLPAVMAFIVIGCADYSLISHRPAATVAPRDRWHELKISHEPEGPVEETVAEAAKLKTSTKVGEITATYLASDETSRLVVATVRTYPESDPMAPKGITYYRIVDGKIDAYTETVTGPSLDEDFERTIYSAAMGAKSTLAKNIVIYRRPEQNFILEAGIENGCVIKVTVIAGLEKNGEVVTERRINICNIKAVNDGSISLPRGTAPLRSR